MSVIGLKSLSLEIREKDIYMLVGSNGSGKSTLFKIITGLLKPTTGTVKILGINHNNIKEINNFIGFVPDTQPNLPNVTPRKLLKTLRIMRRLDEIYDMKWMAYIERFQFTKWIDRPLSWFSQGMLKRIAIITGIFYEPKLLLMDEPLENLDIVGKVLLEKILQEMLDAGSTILISSHILKDDGFSTLKPKILFIEDLINDDA